MGKLLKLPTSNDDRASWALQCVERFKGLTGMTDADERSEAMSDLLCDMMHLADRGDEQGVVVQWHILIANARNHYEAETAYRCEDCTITMEEDVLVEVTHLTERVAAGEIMPAGQCPFCGTLVHANDKEATK